MATGSFLSGRNGFESGEVRVYQYNSETQHWELLGDVLYGEAPNIRFGRSVSLSDDGLILAVGAYWSNVNGKRSGETLVFRYEAQNGVWQQHGRSIQGEGEGDWFGRSVQVSPDGSQVAAGGWFNGVNGQDAGQVRVFDII
jgi:hypothetical protein